MRILWGLLVLLSLAAAGPQDSFELRKLYGEPNVERFEIFPDITLTVEYEAHGRAHVLDIEPRHAFLHTLFAPMPSMSEEKARDALAEVMPETRGREFRPAGAFSTGGGSAAFSFYENLAITEAYSNYEGLKRLEVRAKSGTLPKTSADLHARFGKPDVEEFIVRPDLILTAEYGMDGEACAMRIEVRHNLGYGWVNLPEAPAEEVTAILDEVVPPEARGKKLGAGRPETNSRSGAVPSTEYENVQIQPYYGTCERQLLVRGVDVRFKRPACPSLLKHTEK